MNRVLVVGGAGYIGGLTVNMFMTKMDFEVTVYDNLLYENRYLKPVPFIYDDIRNTDRLAEVSKDFDIIVLLAALVGDPACAANQSLAEEINYLAIKKACEAIPADKHIVFASTCSVYGSQNEFLNEDSPTNPLSCYAITKLAAEKHVLERGGTVFRLGTVYGLGDTYSRIRMDLVVNYLTMRAIKYKEITINGGDQWRPVIAVKDVAKYIVEACETKPSGIFVVCRENITINEIGEKVVRVVPDTKIKYNEIGFYDARNYKVDSSKSKQQFATLPTTTIEEEIARIKEIIINNRVKEPENAVYNNGMFVKEFLK